MDGLVVRFGSLDVGERAHRPTEPFLQPELRQRDLARGLVDLEIGERTMRDPVRLDADPFLLEVGELAPLDRAVEDPARREVLLVRERMTIVDIADGTKSTAG